MDKALEHFRWTVRMRVVTRRGEAEGKRVCSGGYSAAMG